MRLAEERAFPLAGLCGMLAPGDSLVLRRVVTAILDLISDAGIDVFDQSSVERQAEQRRQHALGGAVDRFHGGGVAELGDDGAAAEDEAVGTPALRRERPERPAEDALLVREVAWALGLVRAGELDGGLELRRVEAGRSRVAPRPSGVAGGWDVVCGGLGRDGGLLCERAGDEQGGDANGEERDSRQRHAGNFIVRAAPERRLGASPVFTGLLDWLEDRPNRTREQHGRRPTRGVRGTHQADSTSLCSA